MRERNFKASYLYYIKNNKIIKHEKCCKLVRNLCFRL